MPPLMAPKDKTKREHLARVDRVVFKSDADDFVILSLDDGLTALGPASSTSFARGTIYRFLGKWEDDAARGPRFRFSTFLVHAAHGRTGVVKYVTDICDSFGTKTATRLFDRYGPAAVETLRTTPETVAAELNLSPDVCIIAAAQLDREHRFQATKIDLFDLFHGRGFSGALIERVLDKYGAKAPQVIKRNPFALLGLPSAGFKRCDRLWSDLKLPAASLKRVAIVAENLLKTDSQGHTWLPATDLAARLRELIPAADVPKAFKFALRARKLKRHRDADGKLWLATYHRATSEERIAAAIHRLSQAPCLWPTDRVPVSREEGDRLPSEHQVGELKLATSGPVGILTGGPGTGKSHCTAFLARELLAEFGRSNFGACSPTGKAAVRFTQALNLAGVDLTAKTIHSTLKIGRNGHDGDGWGFEHGPGNPLPYRFIFMDEVSMTDTDLMADFLDACGTGTHILLIGDPYQLPPVGHGAPLRDLLDAGIPHGELTQVRRNAGQIVHACQRIKNGESFETTDVIDLEAKPAPKNLKLIPTQDEAHSREVLVEVLKRMTKFHPVWQTQVIVARNAKGELCRKKLNELLHPLLNPDGYSVDGNPFKVGDKIICLRNSRMHRVEPMGKFHEAYAAEMERDAANYQTVMIPDPMGGPGQQPEEVYIANGEIGRVVAIKAGLTVARFSEGDSLVKIPMGKQRDDEGPEADGDADQGRGCNFDHAYAVSGHRMQGSEVPCAIVMADPDAGMVATREWWYTEISRGSKLCLLIGQRAWIDKQRLRQSLVRRKTHLKELIREVIGTASTN